jgi:hypothetical protein
MTANLQTHLNELLPITDYARTTEWTQRGSAEGLADMLTEIGLKTEQHEPGQVVVHLQKLDDGGYEVTTYRRT